MPTFVLTCESCGNRGSFFVDEWAAGELKSRKPVEKYCPRCRKGTNWAFGVDDRRTGRDRRAGLDRRGPAFS